jgi:hypothetical protein
MRILFIHGFGETPAIFTGIAPAIGREQVFIDLWVELGSETQENLNVSDFAKKLVEKYTVSSQDCVIGHSLGGWIAYFMKQQCGCYIVQIASFTDFNHLLIPIRQPKLIYWLARKGLLFNSIFNWLSILPYRKMKSRQVHIDNIYRLRSANKEAVVKQLQLMYEPVPAIDVTPDLRIHALKDSLVKPPLESCKIVPGDHYSLITHPEAVLAPIQELLKPL